MPRWLYMVQNRQEDGAIHSGVDCTMEPCCIVSKEKIVEFQCDFLQGVMIDEDVETRWQCNKPPCHSGV